MPGYGDGSWLPSDSSALNDSTAERTPRSQNQPVKTAYQERRSQWHRQQVARSTVGAQPAREEFRQSRRDGEIPEPETDV